MSDRNPDGRHDVRPHRNPQLNHPIAQPQSRQKTPRQRNRRDVPDQLRPDEQINADQLAALVGVQKRTVFRWIAGGHLPAYDLKIGQTCRWKTSTIQTWLSGRSAGRR